MELVELVARQLNDYDDSPSGVDQGSYFRWTKPHIEEALLLGVSYLAGLLPNEFAEPHSFKTKCEGCLIEIPMKCAKPLKVISVGDKHCSNVVENSEEGNNLSPLLGNACVIEDDKSFEYKFVSSHLIQFTDPVKKGVKINVLCSRTPKTLSEFSGEKHNAFLVNFALWFLFLSDSESVSNLSRAEKHYLYLRDYVQETLLLNFSLREDDYIFGRRKVDDR